MRNNNEERTKDLRIQHYWRLLAVAVSFYGTVFLALCGPILFMEGKNPGLDANYLLVIASVLGLFWLVFGYVEVLFLQSRVGFVITEEFHKEILQVLGILLLWLALMVCARRGFFVIYCSIYFLYTVYATLWVQPGVGRRITGLADLAVRRGDLTEQGCRVVYAFYCGNHWRVVGTESICIASAAAMLAVQWSLTEGKLWDDFLTSPHLALSLELVISQVIIFISRFRFYEKLKSST